MIVSAIGAAPFPEGETAKQHLNVIIAGVGLKSNAKQATGGDWLTGAFGAERKEHIFY